MYFKCDFSGIYALIEYFSFPNGFLLSLPASLHTYLNFLFLTVETHAEKNKHEENNIGCRE